MARLVRRIARREIAPRGARAKHPQDAVQYRAGVLRRSAASIWTAAVAKQRREPRPLGISEVHTAEYDGADQSLHTCFGIFEIASSLFRGALPLGLPYWLARGDPNAPLRSPGSLAFARSRRL
jgi:hypothetical protein